MSALSTPRTKTSQSCVYPSGVVRIRNIDVCPHSNVKRIAILSCEKFQSPLLKENTMGQLNFTKMCKKNYITFSIFKERLPNLSCLLEILLESNVKGSQNKRKQVRNIAVQLAPTYKNNDSACFLIFTTREIGTHHHSLALVLYKNVDRQSGKRTFYLGRYSPRVHRSRNHAANFYSLTPIWTRLSTGKPCTVESRRHRRTIFVLPYDFRVV